jgi:YebC/PmpR family DNA-binding regulatory protein
MSGHSKWATIKRKKGAIDAKRGKIFTKLLKEIMVAARIGGGDPLGNMRLKTAILAAKAENVPKDNIDRAIKKGTGDLEGESYEEIVYEGYAPGGVAVIVETMTDNRVRTAGEVRHAFAKRGGNLGEPGSVSWMFEKMGLIWVDKSVADEETLMTISLEAGANDMIDNEDEWEIRTSPESFEKVKEELDKNKITIKSSEIQMVASNMIFVDNEDTASQILKLMDMLDDCDDVQKVHANFDIPEHILEKVG